MTVFATVATAEALYKERQVQCFFRKSGLRFHGYVMQIFLLVQRVCSACQPLAALIEVCALSACHVRNSYGKNHVHSVDVFYVYFFVDSAKVLTYKVF